MRDVVDDSIYVVVLYLTSEEEARSTPFPNRLIPGGGWADVVASG